MPEPTTTNRLRYSRQRPTEVRFPARVSSGLALMAIGVIAAVAGYYQPNPALIAFGYLALFLPLAGYVLLRFAARRIAVVRRMCEAAYEGDVVAVELELENRSQLAFHNAQIGEVFVPEMHEHKRLDFAGRLERDSSEASVYHGTCLLPRGVYPLGPTAVRLTDPFGWFEVRKYLKQSRTFSVYPQLLEFEIDERLGRCIAFINNGQTWRGSGATDEFRSVREFRSGDSVRHVHWPLSARRGRPVIREFAEPTRGDLAIVLDACRDSVVGWGRSSSVEYSLKLGLGVIARALGSGRRARLLLRRDERLVDIDGSHRGELRRFLDEMVEFRARDTTMTLSQFVSIAMASARSIPRGSTVVLMVSPYLAEDRGLAHVVRRLRGRAVRVVAVLFEGRSIHGNQHSHAWNPRVGVDVLFRRLQRLGAECLRVTCSEALEMTMADRSQLPIRWAGRGPQRSTRTNSESRR